MLSLICTIDAKLTEVIFLPAHFSASVFHRFSVKVEE